MLLYLTILQTKHLDVIQLNLGIAISIMLIGLTGFVLNKRNILITMLCVEMVYISIIYMFLVLSLYYDLGLIYALILLIIAAAESAVGLGLIIVLYRYGKSINFYDYQELRG